MSQETKRGVVDDGGQWLTMVKTGCRGVASRFGENDEQDGRRRLVVSTDLAGMTGGAEGSETWDVEFGLYEDVFGGMIRAAFDLPSRWLSAGVSLS